MRSDSEFFNYLMDNKRVFGQRPIFRGALADGCGSILELGSENEIMRFLCLCCRVDN